MENSATITGAVLTCTPPAVTLAALDAVATAGLAVTLAYLALERFRYRAEVETVAFSTKKEVGAPLEKENILDASNELRWFCREECNGHTPAGFIANAYHILYRNSFDVWLVSFGATICLLTLAIGCGLELGKFSFFEFLQGRAWISLIYWICILSSSLPVVLIWFGRKCRAWSISRMAHLKRQLEHSLLADAQQAKAVPVS